MKLTHPTNLANFSRLETNKGRVVYFSYETPIAYFEPGETPIVAKNEWAQTTGKHINYVKRLIAGQEFHEANHEFIVNCLNDI